MMSIGIVKSSSDVYAYFTDQDNYYLSDKEAIKEAATWYGKGADILGLLGEQVREEMFLNLLEGRIPGGVQIGQMRDGTIKHRPATDLTFSAPKSVSIMALVHGDTRLIEAHNKAVDAVLDKVQALYAEARKTVDGVTVYEKTGNLTIAKFRHTTSRELDPQLHTHALPMNATLREDGQWRALSSRQKSDIENIEHGFRENIYANQHYLGMIYNSVLAKGSADAGYNLRIVDKHGNFEIEGISEAYLASVSKRRTQITDMMAERGHTGAKAAQIAALNSRKAKDEIDMESLHAYWRDDAKRQGEDLAKVYDDSLAPSATPSVSTSLPAISRTALEAVNDSIAHLSQFNVQFSHGDLVRQAFVFGGAVVEHQQLEQVISEKVETGSLVGKAQQYYTTQALLQTEMRVKQQFAASLKMSFSIDIGRSGIVAKTLKNPDRLQLVNVRGIKNEAALVDEMVKTAENNGLNAYVLHPSRASINRLQHDISREYKGFWSAIKQHFAPELMQTMAGFMQSYPNTHSGFFKRQKHDYIVVLESQKLSYEDAARLDAMASDSQAKVVFLNNTQSTHGYRPGNTLKLLQESGIRPELSRTEKASSLVEVVQDKAPNKALVDYMMQENVRLPIVVTTNKAARSITADIRARLAGQGELSLQQQSITTLSTKGLSDVQKTKTKFYSKGDQVTVYPFTDEQQHYRVVDMDRARGALVLSDKQGKMQLFDIAGNTPFEVKKQQTLEVAVGEQLRTTRNLYIDRETKIEKNTTLTVVQLGQEHLSLSDGQQHYSVSHEKLSHSFLDYGYVVKPHQLTDVDHVITALEGYQLHAGSIGEITEYATRVTLFTTDSEKARDLMDKQGQAWLATEVASGDARHYAPIVRADETIRHDLETVALALTGNEKETAAVAVSYAMAKLGERECGFEITKLMEESMKYALGKSTLADIEAVVEQKKSEGGLIIGETFVTTELAYALETKVLANNKEGQGALSAIYTDAPTLAPHLTQGQKDAVTLALTTQDRFIALQGWSGTGKTTMMNEFRQFAEAKGYRIVGIAPTHKAVIRLDASLNKTVKRDADKIQTLTVAKFLQADADIDDKTIVVVDESSMVGNRMFHDIQERVKNIPGARAMFPGDINQQAAIDSGKPMELSMNNGLKYAEMKEIVRQKDSPVLKSAIELASQKQTTQALKTLETINPQDSIEHIPGHPTLRPEDSYAFETQSFIEVEMDKDPEGKPLFIDGKPSLTRFYQAIANDYLHRIPEQRERTFVIATMHDSRAQIDDNIRIGLKKEGVITGEMPATRLRSRNMDKAELLHSKNYQVGDVVRFSQTYSIAKSGDHMFIAGVNSKTNQLTLIDKDQHTYTINPAAIALKSEMSVFQVIDASLGVGDRVRLRQTDVKRGWLGGAEYRVESINKDTALLKNKDGTLALSLKEKADQHWDYAYTNTTFSVQGDDDKYDIGAMINDNDRTTLIQLSRASHHVTLYTPSKSRTIAQLNDAKKQQQANKTSAIEIVNAIKEKNAASATATSPSKGNAGDASQGAITTAPKLRAEDIKPLLNNRIEELAIALLGQPNKRLSNRRQLRFGNKGSTSVNLRTGQWYSHELGQGGGAFELIKQELGMSDFNDVLAYAARFVNYLPTDTVVPLQKSPLPKKAEPDSPNTGMRDYARRLYADSIPLKGTLGERYLREYRKLSTFDGADIRYLPSVGGKIGDKRVKTPGILAYALDNDGNINHAQVVRLNHQGEKNRDVNVDKQTYGALDGKAVVLSKPMAPPALTYVAEGVETGLSVLNVNRKAHVLATLGVSNFNNIELDRLAEKVLLCLDNDGVKKVTTQTIRAAIKKVDGIVEAVKRLEAAGKMVRVAIPNERNTDFNDVLTQKGPSDLKTQLHQIFTVEEYSKMAKAYFNDIGKGRLDKMANFDLAESVKKMRIQSGPMPLNFKDTIEVKGKAARPIVDTAVLREPSHTVGKLPSHDTALKKLAKEDRSLQEQLTREQVENIANKTPKTKGTEKTL